MYFSNFKKWFDENYIDGYCLDKDIKGNGMLYSPETCIFVTNKVNNKSCYKKTDYNYLKGVNSYKAKHFKYYELFSVRVDHFKKVCKRQGWNFFDFEKSLINIR